MSVYCDICGRTPVKAQILVEGAKLLACGSCMKSGTVLHSFHEDEVGELIESSEPSSFDSKEIVEGYGKIIKNARDRTKLPLSVVAERINERESYLDAIENERLMPALTVAKKLEKELGIKLIEKAQPSVAPSVGSSSAFSPPTLADMVTNKKKKEQDR